MREDEGLDTRQQVISVTGHTRNARPAGSDYKLLIIYLPVFQTLVVNRGKEKNHVGVLGHGPVSTMYLFSFVYLYLWHFLAS